MNFLTSTSQRGYLSRHPQWRILLPAGVVACFVAILHSSLILAQDNVVSREYTIKAGVIGVLSKCVIWPDSALPSSGEPLKIGILGKDPFVENGVHQLERVVDAGRSKGENVVLMHFDSAKDYQRCQILYVSSESAERSEEQTVAERVEAAKKIAAEQTVLIIGESNGLARQGAVANLLYDRTTNLIQLEINPDEAARRGIKLAPDLLRLKLVKIVRDSKAN
jgi:hypothetical protein